MRVTEQSPFRGPEAQRLADQSPSTATSQARRLPSSPRERKPALAALAVLLIIGGALLTVTLVLRSGDRVSAIQINERIAAGQPIPLQAMSEVSIADDGVRFVYWTARQKVTGYYASVDLVPGTLLTEGMVSQSSEELRPGKAVVGLSLKAGQVPPGLVAGQRVQVIYVPGDDAEPRLLAKVALVHSVGGRDSVSGGGTVSVAVVVNSSASPQIAAYASEQKIAIAYLPGVSADGAAAEPTGQQTPESTTRPSARPTTSVKETKPTTAPSTKTTEPPVQRPESRPTGKATSGAGDGGGDDADVPGDTIEGQ